MSQLEYLDIHECQNISEEGKFYIKEKLKHLELILEPYALQKQKTGENPHRQVGFPIRGRGCGPRAERFGVAGIGADNDEDFAGLPMRDRMFMAMDRRRRYVALRMIHRVGRVPPAFQEIEDPPENEHEFQMLMEMNLEEDVANFVEAQDAEADYNNRRLLARQLQIPDESDTDDEEGELPIPVAGPAILGGAAAAGNFPEAPSPPPMIPPPAVPNPDVFFVGVDDGQDQFGFPFNEAGLMDLLEDAADDMV